MSFFIHKFAENYVNSQQTTVNRLSTFGIDLN